MDVLGLGRDLRFYELAYAVAHLLQGLVEGHGGPSPLLCDLSPDLSNHALVADASNRGANVRRVDGVDVLLRKPEIVESRREAVSRARRKLCRGCRGQALEVRRGPRAEAQGEIVELLGGSCLGCRIGDARGEHLMVVDAGPGRGDLGGTGDRPLREGDPGVYDRLCIGELHFNRGSLPSPAPAIEPCGPSSDHRTPATPVRPPYHPIRRVRPLALDPRRGTM